VVIVQPIIMIRLPNIIFFTIKEYYHKLLLSVACLKLEKWSEFNLPLFRLFGGRSQKYCCPVSIEIERVAQVQLCVCRTNARLRCTE
jgi:hypothetical protein